MGHPVPFHLLIYGICQNALQCLAHIFSKGLFRMKDFDEANADDRFVDCVSDIIKVDRFS